MWHKLAVVLVLYNFLIAHGQITPTDRPTRWRWNQVPNPREEPRACGRGAPSLVCDPNGILPYKGANELDKRINETILNTPCRCPSSCRYDSLGYVISVLVIPEFYTPYTGDDQYRMLQEARQFVYSVYSQKWRFARCNQFIVILYAKTQNVLYTMTGRRARERISDASVEQISLDVKQYFEEGPSQNITKGLLHMVRRYRGLLEEREVIINKEKPVALSLASVKSVASVSDRKSAGSQKVRGGSSHVIVDSLFVALLAAVTSVLTVVQ